MLTPKFYQISNTFFISVTPIFFTPPCYAAQNNSTIISSTGDTILSITSIILSIIAILYFFLRKFWITVRVENGIISITTSRRSPPTDLKNNLSKDEFMADLERGTATSVDSLIKEFEDKAKKNMESISQKMISDSSIDISKILSEKISEKIGDNTIDYIGSELTKRVSDEYKWTIFENETSDLFQSMSSRAVKYADAAYRHTEGYRRAAIQLTFIGATALFGIVVYNYYNFHTINITDVHDFDWRIIVLRGGPAVSLVLLIEYIAFLMYRNSMKSLEYMRYFSNEASNINARQVAFIAAARLRSEKKVEKLIDCMTTFERNIILKGGERTAEMEMNKQEDSFTSSYWSKITGTFNFGQKK